MSARGHSLGALIFLSLVSLSVAGRADEDQPPEDVIYSIGQITGSAALCKIAMADINALVAKAFQALDLPLDQGSDSYKRFAAGVTAGGKQVSGGTAKCADVVAAFTALQERFK